MAQTTGGPLCDGVSRSERCWSPGRWPAATAREWPPPTPATSCIAGSPQKEATPSVDVELIIAVDVSYSMDMDELAVQREGYAQAIVSKEFLQALKTGPNGKIAVTYFEWAASSDQKIIIPWRVIDGPETGGRGRRRNPEDADPPGLAHLDLRRHQFRDAAVRRESIPRACGASSIFPATGPTTTARRSPSRATRRWKKASPSTACRSW